MATLMGVSVGNLGHWRVGHRVHHGRLLLATALLMALTDFAFADSSTFWPLLVIAFVGTLNPSSGDVSVFLPLERVRIAEAAGGNARTTLFARYSLLGTLLSAFGALALWRPHCQDG